MRARTACLPLAAVLCGLLLTAVARCEHDDYGLPSAGPEDIRNAMRAVSARDGRWRDVLTRPVRPRPDERAADRLLKTGRPPAAAVTVRQVVARLATDASATGSELRRGAHALGAALSCSLLDTLLVHAFYASVLVRRGRADAATVGRCLSAIRAAVPVYVDKLVAFGQDVQPFVELDHALNRTLARLRDGGRPVAEHVDRLIGRAEAALTERCGGPGVVLAVEEVVDDYYDEITEVDDDRLADMIQDVDAYEYVDLQSYGPARWTAWLDGGRAFDGA